MSMLNSGVSLRYISKVQRFVTFLNRISLRYNILVGASQDKLESVDRSSDGLEQTCDTMAVAADG